MHDEAAATFSDMIDQTTLGATRIHAPHTMMMVHGAHIRPSRIPSHASFSLLLLRRRTHLAGC
jgi:hypothetical protein